MLTPRREAFPDESTVFVYVAFREGSDYRSRPRVDDLNRTYFTAFRLADHAKGGWVPGGVVSQVYRADLSEWIYRQEMTGRDVVMCHDCSFPGCGKPVMWAYDSDGRHIGWRHVNPADEVLGHVGYPMPREDTDTARTEIRERAELWQ